MRDLLVQFEEKLGQYRNDDKDRILKAAHWSESVHRGQKRASGEPYFVHPLKVAEILVDMEMDVETVIAALLHDVLEDTDKTPNDLRRIFGSNVEQLVDGVTKISILQVRSKSIQQVETIRKMLLAMTRDIRVILIKLADKLHNMGTLQHQPMDKRKETALECLDLYAPLADRLGIFWLKAEFEDLSLKHLNPEIYDQLHHYASERRSEGADYLSAVENAVHNSASQEGFDITVSARAKHLYSIYRKMKTRNKDLTEIYDLLGIRIFCESPNECYSILGLVHKLWPPIEGRFKDYVAMPKANGYQSLHTVVMGPEGRLIEVQIRTHHMHVTAEFGVAAHWVYKENLPKEKLKSNEVTLINKLRTWDGMDNSSEEFLNEIKREILKDSIYIFTPKGDIVELPSGSTAIDFAYHIHTEVGNRCVGAIADESIIPLTQALRNTQVIEILTSGSATPHVNWLRHVRTARARSKIRHWLNQHDDSVILDSSIIAKRKSPPKKEKKPEETTPDAVVKHVLDHSKIVFKIGEERNFMIQIARCCNPTTGDDIIGYVSRGRGIIVHKLLCQNLKNINDFDARSVDVEWEAVSPRTTLRFRVNARMTSDLFSEIEGAVRKYQGHLIEGKLDEDERGNLFGAFTMELEHQEDFKQVIKSIRTIPSVMNIQSLH